MGLDYLPDPVSRPKVVQPDHFKCPYCGRYGRPGSCDGCGAPNRPVVLTDPSEIVEYDAIEVTVFGDVEAKYVQGRPRKPPQFNTVKR